ncbi:hypothetical protein, partial [Burkholderia sp. AU45251]|uniref:hypothetical protein n=1 Tax=Burkholderia sp. AU45251 TaxID=3059204 RepID=UPI00264F17F4
TGSSFRKHRHMMDARKLLINLLYLATAQSSELPGWSHRETKNPADLRHAGFVRRTRNLVGRRHSNFVGNPISGKGVPAFRGQKTPKTTPANERLGVFRSSPEPLCARITWMTVHAPCDVASLAKSTATHLVAMMH